MKYFNIIFFLFSVFQYFKAQEYSLEDSININLSKIDIHEKIELFLEGCNQCKIVSNVIDEESIVFVSCLNTQYAYCNNKDTRFNYVYSAVFKIKNESVKIEIKDLRCVSVYGDKDCKPIQPNTDYKDNSFIDKESFDRIMLNLKLDLRNFVDDCKSNIIR